MEKPVLESDAAKSITSSTEESYEKLCKMFRTCHSTMMDIPMSDFVRHCESDQIKSLDLGSTYLNRESSSVLSRR